MTATGRRSRRQARSDCREGLHRYGSGASVGGGIVRRVCSVCGIISIDLTAADSPVGSPMLFAQPLLPEPHPRS